LRAEPAEVTSCEEGFRLIQQSEGADCLPLNVNKVLSLSPMTSQFYLAIGQPSVVRISLFEDFMLGDIAGMEERLDEINAGVREIDIQSGSAMSIGLELLLQVDPEVIISEMNSAEMNKAIETVAPVVVLDGSESWKSNMLKAGEIVGEEETAVEMLAAYEERVEILRSQFDDPSDITISRVALAEGRNTILFPAHFAGQIISDVGFSFPEHQLALLEDSPDMLAMDVSAERMDLLDGDHIFVFSGFLSDEQEASGVSRQGLIDDLQNDSLFQTLGAAQNDSVHQTGQFWSVTGIYSAHYILDDLFRNVAGVDPDEVAPNPLRLE
ncbi:MAG: ABC transporter substrate-binding protein, partial [Chloroflexota bacterium]